MGSLMGVAVEKILGQLIVLGWLSFHFLARFAMITFISNILLMFFMEEVERLASKCTYRRIFVFKIKHVVILANWSVAWCEKERAFII